MAKSKNKSLPPDDLKNSVPPDVDNEEVYRELYRDQLALVIGQFSKIQEFMATKEDLAKMETIMTDKIHQELKPLGKLQGELSTFIRIFYVVAAAALAALFKLVFFPS